jgi:hypothetical protein
MYLEFIYTIFDYYRTLKRTSFLFDVVLPLLIGGFILFIFCNNGNNSDMKSYNSNALALLGVLVGFSITIITILTTGTSRNLNEIKEKITSIKIGKRILSIYDLLVVNLTYLVIIEVFLIVTHLIYPFILSNFSINTKIKYVVFCIVFATLIHSLLLTIRTMTNFYFIMIKKESHK